MRRPTGEAMRVGPIGRATTACGFSHFAAPQAKHHSPPPATPNRPASHHHDHGKIEHVLLISVDGLHPRDLAWFVQQLPASHWLPSPGTAPTTAPRHDPVPRATHSPDMVGQVTDGETSVTGIYYDDTFNHDVFPARDHKLRRPGSQAPKSPTTEAERHQPELNRREARAPPACRAPILADDRPTRSA